MANGALCLMLAVFCSDTKMNRRKCLLPVYGSEQSLILSVKVMEDVVGHVTLCQRDTRNSNMLDFSSGCRGVSWIKPHCHTGRFKFAGQELNVRKLARIHVNHSV